MVKATSLWQPVYGGLSSVISKPQYNQLSGPQQQWLGVKRYHKWVSQGKFTRIQETQPYENKIPIDTHSLASQTGIANQRSLILILEGFRQITSCFPTAACYEGAHKSENNYHAQTAA